MDAARAFLLRQEQASRIPLLATFLGAYVYCR